MAKTPTTQSEVHHQEGAGCLNRPVPQRSNLAGRPDEHEIRERAYGIWLEEGQPHGRELAHWQRAHQELQREAP